MTYGELKRRIKKNGCFLHHHGKKHDIWKNPDTGKLFPVGRHDSQEVRITTLNSILKDSGLK